MNANNTPSKSLTGKLFQEVKDAEIVLGQPRSTIEEWAGEKPPMFPDPHKSFPSAIKEFSEWSKNNSTVSKTLYNSKLEETKAKYSKEFLKTISKILASSNIEKDNYKRRVLHLLRDKFFAFPKEEEKKLQGMYAGKNIDAWGEIDNTALSKEPPFNLKISYSKIKGKRDG